MNHQNSLRNARPLKSAFGLVVLVWWFWFGGFGYCWNLLKNRLLKINPAFFSRSPS